MSLEQRPRFSWRTASDWQRHAYMAIFTALLTHYLKRADQLEFSYDRAVLLATRDARAYVDTFIDEAAEL